MFRGKLGHIFRSFGRYYSRSKTRTAYGKGRRLGTSQTRYRRLAETQGRKFMMPTPDDDKFNPDDLAEMSALFSGLIRDADQGYIMEFVISKADAREITDVWDAACAGEQLAIHMCFNEFGKIMRELKRALKRDDDD